MQSHQGCTPQETAASSSSAQSAGSKRCAARNIWPKGTASLLDGCAARPSLHPLRREKDMRTTIGLLLAAAAPPALPKGGSQPPLTSPPPLTVANAPKLPPEWEATTREI